MILLGDCLERLKELPDNSVDSVVTDPPYGLSKEPDIAEVMQHWIDGDKYEHTSKGFMGKSWDSFVPGPEYWREVKIVMKPGAHALVFCGSRTWDLMSCALRFAGLENRDTIASFGGPPGLAWTFGSGFPKSLNVYKAASKSGLCCECEVNKNDDLPSENLRDLSGKVATEESVSMDTQQDVLEGLCGQTDISSEKGRIPNAAGYLSGLRETLSPEVSKASLRSAENLRLSMPGYAEEFTTGMDCSSKDNSVSGSQWLVEGNDREIHQEHSRAGKSMLAGRRDVQEIEGKLYRPEVCPLSRVFQADGEKRRFHNGTSINNGDALESNIEPDGSRSSQRSQHEKQSDFESGTIPEQSSAQTCRRCGKTKIDQGLGTALKPAWEVVLVFRKPLSEKTVKANHLKWGVGGLNIDATRIGTDLNKEPDTGSAFYAKRGIAYVNEGSDGSGGQTSFNRPAHDRSLQPQGRWPANLILDEQAAFMLDEQIGGLHLRGNKKPTTRGGGMYGHASFDGTVGLSESGHAGASRFFYCAKSSKAERNAGLEGMPEFSKNHLASDSGGGGGWSKDAAKNPNLPRANTHPCVKPQKLMEYLIKLITRTRRMRFRPIHGIWKHWSSSIQIRL